MQFIQTSQDGNKRSLGAGTLFRSNVEGPRFESDMFSHPSLITNSQYCNNAAPNRQCRWQCAHRRPKTPKAILRQLAKRLGRSISSTFCTKISFVLHREHSPFPMQGPLRYCCSRQ